MNLEIFYKPLGMKMFETLTLATPYFLLLLPLFILFDIHKSKHKEALYMPHISFIKHSKSGKHTLYQIVKWMMIITTLLAIANPLYYTQVKSVKKDAIDIVLALDISGSMSMYGFNPKAYKQTRLEVVKEVVSSFIAKRSNDRIGLVLFGTRATIASPLSFDATAQTQIVTGLSIGSLGKSTALVDAIVSATILLKESKSSSKVLILLSDGEDSSSTTPLNIALSLAKKYGIKIYTIIIDKTHSNLMKLIAKSSQTKPYLAKNKEDLAHIYTTIEQLEKSDIAYHTLRIPQPLFYYPLFIALLCGFILLILRKNVGIA